MESAQTRVDPGIGNNSKSTQNENSITLPASVYSPLRSREMFYPGSPAANAVASPKSLRRARDWFLYTLVSFLGAAGSFARKAPIVGET